MHMELVLISFSQYLRSTVLLSNNICIIFIIMEHSIYDNFSNCNTHIFDETQYFLNLFTKQQTKKYVFGTSSQCAYTSKCLLCSFWFLFTTAAPSDNNSNIPLI